MPEPETSNPTRGYGFHFEPALWMGLVRAVVMGASAWGFHLTQEQTLSIYALTEAVTSLVTRSYSRPVGQ